MRPHIFALGVVFGLTISAFIKYPHELKLNKRINSFDTVTITAYNPVKSQCYGDPWITASGDSIRIHGLAMSRELLKRYNDKARYGWGDTVYVTIPMIVNDSMNKRIAKTIDILLLDKKDALLLGKRSGYVYKLYD